VASTHHKAFWAISFVKSSYLTCLSCKVNSQRLTNTGDKTLQNVDLAAVLNDAENDLRNGIEQIVFAIKSLSLNVDKLKVQTTKPDKLTAEALLEYIAMEDGKIKTNMEILYSKEIEQYFKWIDKYCSENTCTQEEALNQIINSEI
jgi:transcription elongation factor Elf1